MVCALNVNHHGRGLSCKAALKWEVCPPATKNNMTCSKTEHNTHSLHSQEGQELARNKVLLRNLQTCFFFSCQIAQNATKYLNLSELILEVISALVLMNILYFPVSKISSNWKKLQEKAQCTACYFVLVSANIDMYYTHSALHMPVYCLCTFTWEMYLWVFTIPEINI